MKSHEFLTEWVYQGKVGPFGWGIGDHLLKRMKERNIPLSKLQRIIKRIPYVKPQLIQMEHFKQFYLRDNETGVEIGCMLKTFGVPETRFIYMNTVVGKGEPRKDPESPVITVN